MDRPFLHIITLLIPRPLLFQLIALSSKLVKLYVTLASVDAVAARLRSLRTDEQSMMLTVQN